MARLLLTGATGFVGRALVPRLLKDGHSLVAAVRQPIQEPLVDDVLVHPGLDVAPGTDWRQALSGVGVVVHLASLAHEVHAVSEESAYRRVNVEGTRVLAEAAAAAGVRRFVHMSTVKVMGERSPVDRPWREDDPCDPEGPYGRTKLEGEREVQRIGETYGMETVILRPPVVYGPRLKANLLRLLRAVDRGIPLPLARATARRSLLFGENLADVVAVALRHPRAAGSTFLLSDGMDVSTAELARKMGAQLGRPARLLPVPKRLLRWGGAALGVSRDIDRVLAPLAVDLSRTRDRLEWNPPHSLDEGLARTVAWYKGRS